MRPAVLAKNRIFHSYVDLTPCTGARFHGYHEGMPFHYLSTWSSGSRSAPGPRSQHMSVAIPEASRPAKKASRRWLRALGTLGMAALFTAGIVYMMMALAGHFEPKVKPVDYRSTKPASSRSREPGRGQADQAAPDRVGRRHHPRHPRGHRRVQDPGAGQGGQGQGGPGREGGRGACRAR